MDGQSVWKGTRWGSAKCKPFNIQWLLSLGMGPGAKSLHWQINNALINGLWNWMKPFPGCELMADAARFSGL